MGPARLRQQRRIAANDNPVANRALRDDDDDGANGAIFRAALHHFARHGAAAASVAFAEAEGCRHASDHQGYVWWLDICQTLDRRMAQRLQMQCGS